MSANIKNDKRERLIDAAIEVFRDKGVQAARVSDIVTKAGVAQGTFYLYFNSKDAVFGQICEDFMLHYNNLFMRNADLLAKGGSKEEMIINGKAFLKLLLQSCQDNIAVAQLLFGEGVGPGGPYQQTYEKVLNYIIDLIKEYIAIGIKKNIVDVEDPELAAVMIFGLFQRSMFYYLLIKKEKNPNLDELERKMSNFIIKGLSIQ